VLCDATEQKNFQAKYNKKLPCTGEEIDAMTWDDFKNIGEFFRRKTLMFNGYADQVGQLYANLDLRKHY